MNEIQFAPEDEELFEAIQATLKQNNVEFTSAWSAKLQKSEDGTSEILAYLIHLKTPAIAIAAIKFLVGPICDYLKTRHAPLKIKISGLELEIPQSWSLKDVVAAVEKISRKLAVPIESSTKPEQQQSRKPKNQ